MNGPSGVCGDATVAATTIDRLEHYVQFLSLNGDNYRLKNRDIAIPLLTSAAYSWRNEYQRGKHSVGNA